MTLSSEQFHTLYDGAAQPVILVRDGAVAELNCHAQELFAVGTALRAYLPQDAALPEMLYARPAVLPVMAGGVCVSANTQPLDDALLLFLPPQDTRDELAAFCRAAGAGTGRERASPERSRVGGRSSMVMSRWSV